MANEITVSMSLAVVKGATSEKKKVSAATFDMTGTDYVHGTMQVLTSGDALIPLHAVGTAGWAMFTNNATDPTFYIEIWDAVVSGAPLVKMWAGESACFRIGVVGPVAKAFVGNCEMDYFIIED